MTDGSIGIYFLFHQAMLYEYFGKDEPEVYCLHFMGSDVQNIPKKDDVQLYSNVFYAGNSPTYGYLFKEMILELQTCRIGYESLLSMYLEQILVLIQRAGWISNPSSVPISRRRWASPAAISRSIIMKISTLKNMPCTTI